MPFPPSKNDHDADDKKSAPQHDDRSAPSNDHDANPHHNAPMPDTHKQELAKHDVAVSPGHVNHGPGHH